MTKFDADTLRALHDVQEPRIRTSKHPDTAIIIWVMVDGDDVFVRSWLGAKGRCTRTWQQAATPRWSLPTARSLCGQSRQVTMSRSIGPTGKFSGNIDAAATRRKWFVPKSC